MSANQPPPPPPPGGYGGPPTPPGGGYGGPPPPPGGGGYGGPPPGGGYGGPPQGGGYGGYPGQPGSGNDWELGKAVGYGWEKFQANMAQMIIAMLAILVSVAVIIGIYIALSAAFLSPSTECVSRNEFGCTEYETSGGGFLASLVVGALVFALLFIVVQLISAGIIRACLGVTEGRPFQASEVFKFQQIGSVLTTAVILGVAVGIGTLLCYIPGIIIAFLTAFSMYFVVDKNMAPMDAIKASFELVKNNVGSALIWLIVGGIIAGIGAVVCLVGILVTYPIYFMGTAYTYKKLTGQPVAP